MISGFSLRNFKPGYDLGQFVLDLKKNRFFFVFLKIDFIKIYSKIVIVISNSFGIS